ncbi:hypothetical protein B7463_g9821, partial [Scytalidium lignicola]
MKAVHGLILLQCRRIHGSYSTNVSIISASRKLRLERKQPYLQWRLLTHTSGFVYTNLNPKLKKWVNSEAAQNAPKTGTIVDSLRMPLSFEPGTGWEYGLGHDWAGVVVSRLNNTTLQAYMEKNIWAPLDIKLMTFHPDEDLEVQKRLVGMSRRGPVKRGPRAPMHNSDEKVEWTDEALFEYPIVDEWGGVGSIGAPTDYIKILLSLLVNDGRLLSSDMVDQMFSPQLGPDPLKAYEINKLQLYSQGTFSGLPEGTKDQFGLGSRLVMSDVATGLREGALQWAGLPNLLWTIDRKAGLCMFFASNLVPFGDSKIHEYQQLFEKEMYTRFGKSNSAS